MSFKTIDFINSEFPSKYRALLPEALKSAYNAVNLLYQDIPMLNTPSAKFGKGDLIAYSVDYQIKTLIDTQQLPFDYRWVSFEKPTGKYLQIRLSASTLSISQLSTVKAVPRDASFRNNKVLNNQTFLDLPCFEEERLASGLPHLILAHGYQALNFAQIALRHPTQNRWMERTPNIMLEPYVVTTGLPPEEAVDIEADVSLKELKEQIIRLVKEEG